MISIRLIVPVLALGLTGLGAPAHAQSGAVPLAAAAAPQNVLQLSATGRAEAPQDWLTLTLSTTRDGASAAQVQAQLSEAVEAALGVLKKDVKPGQFEVHSDSFGLYPRYDKAGKISGWQGRASVVLEGRDVARITEAAARATTLSVAQLGFSLSRELRERLQGQAQSQAIARFTAKAGEIAKAFGFAGYTLREVSVSSDEAATRPPIYGMARAMAAEAAPAPVPVEAGKGEVRVTVSGSVQAR